MKWAVMLCLVFLLGCNTVERVGIIKFTDCEIHYVGSEMGNPISGTMKTMDRFQHTYSDNKTVFLKGDVSTKESVADKMFKTIPIPLPVF